VFLRLIEVQEVKHVETKIKHRNKIPLTLL